MLLAVYVLVVFSQKCATVNSLRGTEVTLPLLLAGRINNDKQRNTLQDSIHFVLMQIASTSVYYVTTHISKGKKKSAIKGAESNYGPP